MGSAVFAEAGAAARAGVGAGWGRLGCAFGDAGRAGAVAWAGITGAIGLPAAMGLAAATTAGLP